MTKILFLASLFLFVACNPDCKNQTSGTTQKQDTQNAAACPAPTPTPDPTPVPTPGTGEVPNEALTFDATVNFTNFDVDQEDKVHKAIEIIKKVVASQEFKDKVINYTYNGAKQFVDNKGLTNEQIYQIILDGKEDLLPVVDNQMDLDLELYYTWTSTVGYTTPDTLKIYLNTKFFNPFTPAEVAGNVFHEWTHKLGFEHASSYSVSRDSSVPYAIGYLIRDLGKKYE